jgi:hypothetical protein
MQNGSTKEIWVSHYKVEADNRPAAVPEMAAGAMSRASIKDAASSDCSSVEVLSQPAGRGLRELARRS